MNILITEGDNRSALAVTQSLGKRGHRVVVAAAKAKSLASCSRYCAQGCAVPDPMSHGEAYVAAICDLAVQENIELIFPMTEQSIYRLNPVRGSLPAQTRLACPAPGMMAAVADKLSLLRLAESLQVATPQTFYLSGTDELSTVIGKIASYPVVVKPALSRRLSEGRFLFGGVRYAATPAELAQLYATTPVLRYPSLIQEKIYGPGTGLFTLYDKNRHLALFSHKRLREKPPSGGVSVVSESVPLDEEMVAAADRLLAAVGFAGVAMVEFKRDQRDGKAKLMEINGRFWGSLQLAVACGVDFPLLYLEYLQGRTFDSPLKEYKTGHKLKWFFGTLDHLIIRFANSDRTLNLPDDAPSKWRALSDFLRVREPDTSFDVFSRDDPGPFVAESAAYLKAIWGRG